MHKTMIKIGSALVVLVVVAFGLSSKPCPPPLVVASFDMPVCTQHTGVTHTFLVDKKDTLIERTVVVEITSLHACSGQTGVAKIWDGALLVSQATFSGQDLPIHLGTGAPSPVTRSLTAEVFWQP